MSRVEIKVPDQFVYETEYTITPEDLNYGGHVGNDRFLGIANVLRLSWLAHLGYKDELSFGNNIGIIISDAAIQYKAEGFEGDRLRCRVGVQDVSKYGFDLVYVLEKGGKQVTVIKTGILTIDYQKRKVASIPEDFRSRLLTEEP